MISVRIDPPMVIRLGMSAREAKSLLQAVVQKHAGPDAGCDLWLTDDLEMSRLNREFLGLAGPTNVLSFPAEDDQDGNLLGSIVLCVEALRRESRLYGQPLRDHLIRLLTHAVLHLAGMGHGPLMEELTEDTVAELTDLPGQTG